MADRQEERKERKARENGEERMKIIAERGGMNEVECEKCPADGNRFMFPAIRCGPDTVVWCPKCNHRQRWAEVEKFSKETPAEQLFKMDM